MSVQHKNLTGADLHEPKGVATAGAGTVYEADGAGSGSWVDPLINLNNENLVVATGQIADLSTPNDYCVIPAPLGCTAVRVAVVARANFTGAPNVITAEVVSAGTALGAGTATDLSISMTNGSGAHAVFSGTISSNNSLTTSQAIIIKTDGGGTGASVGDVIVNFDVS